VHEQTVLSSDTFKRSVDVLLEEDHVCKHVKVKHLVVSVQILILTQLSVRAYKCVRVQSEINFQRHKGKRNQSLIRLHYTDQSGIDRDNKLDVPVTVLSNLHRLSCQFETILSDIVVRVTI
jgi:hypothetical protein